MLTTAIYGPSFVATSLVVLEIFDTKILKTKYFQAFFLMYLQAHEHRDFCAIFESRFRAPNDVRTGNRDYVCIIFIALQAGEGIFEISL